MPPKKAAVKAPATKAKVSESAKPLRASTRKVAETADAPAPATSSNKRKAAGSDPEEPKAKKSKTAATTVTKPAPKKATGAKKAASSVASTAKVAAPKKAAAKPAAKAVAKKLEEPTAKAPVKKATSTKKAAVEKPAPKTAKPAAKKEAAHKKAAAPKAAPKKKIGPTINDVPTRKLNVYVFGEGSAGELGLGATKFENKKPVDVKRPRLNHLLSAKTVGVVCIAVGGMHCAALTHDNKILTWGVNDQGALGRETTNEGRMKDISKEDDSDSDSDDEGEGLNPSEAEPREVDPIYFPEGTKFSHLVACDSATFAITTDGSVYGWGTFRGNDGILGFRKGVQTQRTPVLIPELKKITALASGTNHVLALNDKGQVFAWGAGEQNQLARRVVSRTAIGALIPREFGLQKKDIAHIGCGDYHSFAIAKDGKVYSWGLNTFGQTGIPKDEDDENNTITIPTLVENLGKYAVKQIEGGAHHTISVTESGQVLIWGRIDNAQGGMEISKFNKDDLFFDEHDKPRFLIKPVVIPGIKGEYISAGADSCLVVTKEGQAYSWGFSANYQTGQGTTDDIKEATLIDNTAVKGKKLCWAGAGGQFSVLCAEAEDAVMANGI